MKCNHCGSEWSAAADVEKKWEKCPFCGMSLTPETPTSGSVQDVLMRIHGRFGEEVFGNDRKLLAVFSDLAPGLIPQRRLLQMLLKCDGHKKLLAVKAGSHAEQTACISRLVVQMNEELFIDEGAAKMICQAVLDALMVPTTQPPKEPEVREESKAREEQLCALVTVLSELHKMRNAEQKKEQLKALTRMVTEQLKARNAALEQAKKAEPVPRPAEPKPVAKPVSDKPTQSAEPAVPSETVPQAKASENVMVAHTEPPQNTLAMDPPRARKLVPSKANDPQRERFRSYQSRSSEGDLNAMFMLAWCYEKGEGVAVNEPLAVHCYEFAIDHGEDHSIRALMELWERKEPLTIKDLETAQRLMGKKLNARQELMLRNVLNFAGARIAKIMVSDPKFCSSGSMLLKKCADSGNEAALKHLSAGDGTDGGIALTRSGVMKTYNQYELGDKYILSDSKIFEKKCLKAIAAYAYLETGEIPLLLEDTSRFGSGKEGILLTDRALYVKQGKENSYRIKPDRVMSVGLTPPERDGRRRVQFLCTSDGNRPFKVCFTFCEREDEANRVAGFWKTLLGK